MNTPSATVLKLLMLLAMSLLLALLPFLNLQAQNNKKGPKQMHIKIIREGAGKTVIKDTVLTIPDMQELRSALKELQKDTVVLQLLSDGEIRKLRADIQRQQVHVEKLEELREGDSIRFRSIDPVKLRRLNTDSVKVIHLDRLKDREVMPDEVERIIVERHRRPAKGDSVLVRNFETRLKVITDEKTGEKKVYRIDESGREEELKGKVLRHKGNGRRTVVIIREAKVQDISPEDKEALKEAGSPVETKRKEELKVEEISFYPNPNNGRFTLNFTLDKKATTVVRIMDSKGNEVFVDTVEKLAGQYNREIDLRMFGPGIYYLQVAQGKRYHTKKIVVQ